jgi:hypothetical protein
MSLNESIVEEAALEWFHLRLGYGGQVGALDYAVGHGATFAKLRRAKPHHHQSRTLATLRDPAVAGLPKLLSGELSVGQLRN